MLVTRKSPPLVRFWNKVLFGERCWEWTGAKHKFGHGHLRYRGKDVAAHRFVFEWFYERFLLPGECVLHSCDNPSCVRPTHLFVGTKADNVYDMLQKGRHGNRRLTFRLARQIRVLHAYGVKRSELAAMFGVSIAAINNVVYGYQWKPNRIVQP
jgi:hypothetical protein